MRGKCRQCAKLLGELERWERRYSQVLAKMSQLEKQVRQLREALAGRNKDSTNSSKPPSSDIVKPAKKPTSILRCRGLPVGHAPQQRLPFQAAEIDAGGSRTPMKSCPQCGGPVELLPTPAEVVQQVETRG